MSEHETGSIGEQVDPLVGKVLGGRFVLQKLVSRGGMGKVYRAMQKPLDRVVALKILDVVDSSGEFRRRFFMEASLCAKLSHPHTVRVYDYGATDDGIFYIAMEYLEGQTLHEMLYREAPIEPMRAVVIARRICGALAEAHAAGIVHRDLKPANIFLVRHGDDPEFPKVIDFGLVKELGKESELSRTGHVLGSPMYMAPEQVEAREVDARTDVYALGLMLYQALCGKTPFKRGNPMSMLLAQVQQHPKTFKEVDPYLAVPPVIEWVVRRCIEKKMEDRFADMHELMRALKAAELVMGGEVVGSTTLALENGRVVLPDGIDVSDELKLPGRLARRASMPPPTPVPFAGASESFTLSNPQLTGDVTLRTGMGLVVAGSAVAAVVALLVAVVAIVAAVWTYQANQQSEVAPLVAPVEVQAARLDVRLTSEPTGAEVDRDGHYVGTTPVVLKAVEGEAYSVVLRAPGHEDRTVRIDGSHAELSVPLTPLVQRVAPEASSPGTPDVELVPVPVTEDEPEEATPRRQPSTELVDPWEENP